MTKKRRSRTKRAMDWMRADPRPRIPLVAASVAMVACLIVWLLLVAVLILLGRREDAASISGDLQVPFITLVIATMALSMRIGRIHIRLGRWLHVLVHELAARERPFGEGEKVRSQEVTIDDVEKELRS